MDSREVGEVVNVREEDAMGARREGMVAGERKARPGSRWLVGWVHAG